MMWAYINKSSKFLGAVSKVFGRIAILAMLGETVFDILARSLFSQPLPGVVDMVELSMAVCVFSGIAMACYAGAHLAVDLIDLALPTHVRYLLGYANSALMFSALGVLTWLGWHAFIDKLEWSDRTVDLGIPLAWHWGIVLVGFAAAAILSVVHAVTHRQSKMQAQQ